ncbi:MAG TPA: S24 family peptidase [Kiloniellales bacterium]
MLRVPENTCQVLNWWPGEDAGLLGTRTGCLTDTAAVASIAVMKELSRFGVLWRRHKKLSGLTQDKIALAARPPTSQQHVHRLCYDQDAMTWEWARRLAPAFPGTAPEDLISEPHLVEVIGRPGRGGEVLFYERDPEEHSLDQVRCPTVMDAAWMAALEVVDDSLYPEIENGDIVFFDHRLDGVPDELVGHRCVVKLADGRLFVKRLRRGSAPDHFTLDWTNAPALEDMPVVGAARAVALPRDHVLADAA